MSKHTLHQEMSQALAEQLADKNPGWTPNVWENDGGKYCYNLVKDHGQIRWHLSEKDNGTWAVYSYGATPQVWTDGYETPQEAVNAAVEELRKVIKVCANQITQLTGVEL